MCLKLVLIVPVSRKAALCDLPATIGPFTVQTQRVWPWSRMATAVLAWEGGCACPMLTDQADWNAPFWDLRKDVLPSFADALKSIGLALKSDFEFYAVWQGDQVISDKEVNLLELMETVQENQLGNRIRYRVHFLDGLVK